MELLAKVNNFLKAENSKKIIHAFFSMFIGSMIYILFREKRLLMFKWFKFIKLDFVINFLRDSFYKYRIYIPKRVLFSLPDALFLSIYFKNKIILSSIFVGSMIIEILQLWFVTGTFDMYDVIYMFILYLIAMYFIEKIRRKKI